MPTAGRASSCCSGTRRRSRSTRSTCCRSPAPTPSRCPTSSGAHCSSRWSSPGSNWMVPAHRVGDGAALLRGHRRAQGMEGVMAKRLGSPYLPGKRSPNWRKVKHRVQVEVVIGGFNQGTGNRARTRSARCWSACRRRRLAARSPAASAPGSTRRGSSRSTATLRALATTDVPVQPAAAADATWPAPPGCGPSCGRWWRSPSSPTTATSATPASSACCTVVPSSAGGLVESRP